MYIVTGGAGFIGSNLVRGLNQQGITNILVVDNLERSAKFLNLQGCRIADYMDKREFRAAIQSNRFAQPVEAIFHQGACSDTMEYNGLYMMDNNFTASKEILHYAIRRCIPMIYASSAAVYGNSITFQEEPANERPLNIYGYSKLMFDEYVRHLTPEIESTVVGLRYFNVYGPNETQKGRMASTAHQFSMQLRTSGIIKLFQGTDGYADGEQRRDFIFVGDLIKLNLFFAQGPQRIGIFNAGTGKSRSFNDVAHGLIRLYDRGEVQYVPFPETLQGKYQSFTEADISTLRRVGYLDEFTSLEDGLKQLYGSY